MRTQEKVTAKKVTKLKHAYSSPRWTGEIADCSMPITFDNYGRCSYGCFYCFANYQKAIGCSKKNFEGTELNTVNIKRVKEIFTGERKSQFWPLIKQRKVIQWGGMADPFCNYEKEFGSTLELLRFFKEIDYPICFSTKGTWWTKDKRYTELFEGQENWNVKVSIITMDKKLANFCEAGVPSPRERLNAIERIAAFEGGGATLRLRPFIIGVSDPTHVELIKEAGKMGAGALSTEFFCLETRSQILKDDLNKVSNMVGFNIMKFYKKYSYSAGYLRLNRKVKKRFVDDMEAACEDADMRFYVSDAHFKERCANGSCCGLPEDWNYVRGQWCEALQIAKDTGKVRWRDMAKHLGYAKKFLYRRADGFNTGGCKKRADFHTASMYDYLRTLWNDPQNGQNPHKMYEGILKPCGKDKGGNIIYKYNLDGDK